MSNVAIFKIGKTPQYLISVNTPDYDKDPDVLVNPDISAVKDVPLEHWKRDKDKIVEMSEIEKGALEFEKQVVIDERIEDLNIDTSTLANALIAHGVISKTELVNAIKEL